MNDESLGAGADLSTVSESRLHSDSCSFFNISVVQDNKRITSTKLHDRLLGVLTSEIGDSFTTLGTSSEGDTSNLLVLDDEFRLTLLGYNIGEFSVVEASQMEGFLKILSSLNA